jgi:hypothetical protein
MFYFINVESACNFETVFLFYVKKVSLWDHQYCLSESTDSLYEIYFQHFAILCHPNVEISYRITGFFIFFIVWYSREDDVSETGSVSYTGEGGGEDTYSVGPFRKS